MQNKKYLYQGLTVALCALMVVLGWVYFVYGTSIGTDIETSNASTTGTFIVGGVSTLTGNVTMSGNVLIVGTTTLATTTMGTNFFIDEVGNASTTGTFIVGGASTLIGNVAMSGNSAVTGGFEVAGTTTLATTTIGTNFFIDEVGNASTTGTLAVGGTTALGGGTPINKIIFGTIEINPDNVSIGTTGLTMVSLAAATADMVCFLQPPDILEDALIPKGCTTTAGNIGVYLYNATDTAQNGLNATWGYLLIK